MMALLLLRVAFLIDFETVFHYFMLKLALGRVFYAKKHLVAWVKYYSSFRPGGLRKSGRTGGGRKTLQSSAGFQNRYQVPVSGKSERPRFP